MTRDFGKITQNEYSLKSYAADTTASAVVLYERGKNTFEIINRRMKLIKFVHKRIKIFDAKKFNETEISIPYYHSKGSTERVEDIKAVTHNGALKKFLNTDNIYDVDLSERWSEKRFTIPDIQDGSIIEYTYKVVTPYFFNFGNWEFQGDIPKVYSEFSAYIPGNYVYNRSITGSKKLDINEVDIKSNCLEVPGVGLADCEASIYAMHDIPAYKKESYMLAEENYISKLNYQLTETTDFEGVKNRYAKTWEDVDNEYKNEKDIGRQLKYTSQFEELLPDAILSILNEKERAIAVYSFIRDYYTWNRKYRIFSEIRVKKALENKKGNIAEINLSLINALRAAGLDSFIALSSTRSEKIPSSLYPVLTDFNYVLAYVKIGEESFLLDATNKNLSFGMLPFKALNVKARVMDFKNGSYWIPIKPKLRNVSYTEARLSINEDLEIVGDVKRMYGGYLGYNYRNLIAKDGIEKVNKESSDYDLFEATVENMEDREAPLAIAQKIESEVEELSGEYFFYPFALNTNFNKNPFVDKKREFPIDFGYDYSVTYRVNIEVNDDFKIVSIPSNKAYSLPNNDINCDVLFSLKENENVVQCSFRFKLRKTSFKIEEYESLRKIYNEIVNLNKNSIIKLIQK